MKSEATLPIRPVLAGVRAAGACCGWEEGVEKDDEAKLEPNALFCCGGGGGPALAC